MANLFPKSVVDCFGVVHTVYVDGTTVYYENTAGITGKTVVEQDTADQAVDLRVMSSGILVVTYIAADESLTELTSTDSGNTWS